MQQQFANQVESLAGQTVVITGGTSGIGLATARKVIDRGGNVILMGRSAERLNAAREALATAASTVQLVVTDEDAVKAAFASIDHIDHSLRLPQGHFAHVSSISIPDTLANYSSPSSVEMSTLAAIDGAIEALARTMALELAPVRVNAITPGQIDTPLWRSRLSETEARGYFDRVAGAHPVARAGTADDVAHAILFLMTNGFVTGAVLDIDGGWR